MGLGQYGYGINNITGNTYGVWVYNCNPVLLSMGNNWGSHNNIYNNSNYEVYATNNSGVYASYNYWGYSFTPPPSTEFGINGSTIDYSNSFTSLIPGGLSKSIPSNANITVDGSGIDPELITALQFEINNNYDNAILVYKNIVKNKTDNLTVNFALSRLSICYDKTGKKDFLSYIKNDVRESNKSKKEVYAWTLMLENFSLINASKFDEYISNINLLRNTFPKDEDIDKQTLFDLGYAYLNYLTNKTKAEEYFIQLKQNYPDDPLVYQSQILLGDTTSLQNNPKFVGGSENNSSNEINNKPISYDLIGNYPNPFNPSTTIKYALPKESDVQLTIYDIMGREVKTLVFSRQEAGYEEVIWDGTDNNNQKVSSGIYIYRLRAVSTEDLKVFDKSAKLVLIK